MVRERALRCIVRHPALHTVNDPPAPAGGLRVGCSHGIECQVARMHDDLASAAG